VSWTAKFDAGDDCPDIQPTRGIRAWVADKLKAVQDKAWHAGEPIPMTLPPNAPVFYVPTGLLCILDRDSVAAGIARLVRDPLTGKMIFNKRDERGRTIDVHALRHTFASLLSKGGVAPRTAQATMRHGNIDLTMQTHTDPKLLDVRGALDVLPAPGQSHVALKYEMADFGLETCLLNPKSQIRN